MPLTEKPTTPKKWTEVQKTGSELSETMPTSVKDLKALWEALSGSNELSQIQDQLWKKFFYDYPSTWDENFDIEGLSQYMQSSEFRNKNIYVKNVAKNLSKLTSKEKKNSNEFRKLNIMHDLSKKIIDHKYWPQYWTEFSKYRDELNMAKKRKKEIKKDKEDDSKFYQEISNLSINSFIKKKWMSSFSTYSFPENKNKREKYADFLQNIDKHIDQGMLDNNPIYKEKLENIKKAIISKLEKWDTIDREVELFWFKFPVRDTITFFEKVHSLSNACGLLWLGAVRMTANEFKLDLVLWNWDNNFVKQMIGFIPELLKVPQQPSYLDYTKWIEKQQKSKEERIKKEQNKKNKEKKQKKVELQRKEELAAQKRANHIEWFN